MDSKIAIKQLKAIEKIINSIEEKPQLAGSSWNKNWHTLIAIMLSAQTRDTTTIEVCKKLFKKYKTPGALAKASLNYIEKDINSVNYHKTKAERIRETAKIISKKGIGESVEELIKFPGVGRKTANVYLAEVHGVAAIGVDVHVARISKKLRWTKNKDPNKVEQDLLKLFPKRYWNSVNFILVSFGQTVGRSRAREDEALERIGKLK
jgi:endonuclease III